MLQTLEIANNDNYYEKNKILGKHPNEFQVITYFIARKGLVVLLLWTAIVIVEFLRCCRFV